MTIHYLGSLRCEATHLRSGNTLFTDAPPDNRGRGEAFSPTDLLCTSLACCMITLMGITAGEKGLEMGEVTAEVEKVMANDPRRVVEIRLRFRISGGPEDEKGRRILEHAAHTCPVARSIHPDIRQVTEFIYI